MEEKDRPSVFERLGELALGENLLTQEQLDLGLDEQRELSKSGRFVPLGQILIRRGFLSADALAHLLRRQQGTAFAASSFHGRYELLRKLGTGGTGEVHLAWDPQLSRRVAIKVLREGIAQNPTVLERFLREAKTLARFRHPNLVGIHEVGEHEGRPFLVMDYLEGDPLDDLLSSKEIPLSRKLPIYLQIVEAVAELHREGVVHRDLKPSNVILTPGEVPVIVDFGLARDTSRPTKLTLTGTVMGTPHYMAPEQVEGGPTDLRTDVYSLGVLLYQFLTDRFPFHAPNDFQLYRRILDGDPTPPSVHRSSVPRDLERVCVKAMERDPARRYQSAEEVAEEVRRHLRGEAVQARPSPVLLKAWKRMRARRIWVAVSQAVVIGGFLAGAIVILSTTGRSSRVPELLREGRIASRDGRIADAERAFLRVRDLDGGNEEAKAALEKIRGHRANIDRWLAEARPTTDAAEARRLYGLILRLDRTNERALAGLAECSQIERRRKILKDAEASIERFEDARRLPPDAFRRDAPEALLRTIAESLQTLPAGPRRDALLGQVHALQGNLDIASQDFVRAVAAAPKTARSFYYYMHGRVGLARYRERYLRLLRKRSWTEETILRKDLDVIRNRARSDFTAAIQEGPLENWPRSFAELVRTFLLRGPRTAFDAAARIVPVPDDPEFALLLAQMAMELGAADYERARTHIEALGRRLPSHADLHAGMATLFMRFGTRKDAIQALTTAVALSPREEWKLTLASLLLLEGGDFDTALQGLDSTRPEVRALRASALLQAASTAKDPDEALRHLEQVKVALGSEREDGDCRYLRGKADVIRFFRTGRLPTTALEEFQAAEALGRRRRDAAEGRAWVYLCRFLADLDDKSLVAAFAAADEAILASLPAERSEARRFRSMLRLFQALAALNVNKIEIARVALTRCVEDSEDPALRSYLKAMEDRAALASAHRALSARSSPPKTLLQAVYAHQLRFLQALCLQSLGPPEKAREAWRSLERGFPGFARLIRR